MAARWLRFVPRERFQYSASRAKDNNAKSPTAKSRRIYSDGRCPLIKPICGCDCSGPQLSSSYHATRSKTNSVCPVREAQPPQPYACSFM